MVLFVDTDDAIEVLSNVVSPGVLGVEKVWPTHFMLSLMARRPDVKIVNGSVAIDMVRMVKDAEEIELMRESSRLNDLVFAEMPKVFDPDMTEIEYSKAISGLYEKIMGVAGGPMVSYGASAADPHHNCNTSKAKKGDCILIDCGKPYKMYSSDATRTFFYGEPSDHAKKVYETVLAANLAAEAMIKPGVRCCDIDAAGRKIIEDAGWGPYFTHRLGHNIGLEGHEWPDIGPLETREVVPGMCFSVEPGIYLPDDMGVRIEDLVIVTEDGVEVINHYTKELQVIG